MRVTTKSRKPESVAGTETATTERALLVQVICGRHDKDEDEDSIGELERLADTAGAIVVGTMTQRRRKPTTSFFVGEGKLADIKVACNQARANLLIFDNDLSSIQVNNLDLALNVKVIDRTELILQIFARRARSSEAQLQVELAQLQYLVSRIPTSRKQQRFQGGIGMKGPGESPLQLRNAPMRRRIRQLKKKIENIQQRRRRTRTRRHWPVVCLAGYTNAGKSTLLNAFTTANAYVDDRLFATLDTKTRLVHLEQGVEVLLTDTVGFIRHLPHGLVASFQSTLEVAAEADILLVVADASHPRVLDHLRVVNETLKKIGADGVQPLLILNKSDRPEARPVLPHLQMSYPEAVTASALTGTGLPRIKARIMEMLAGPGQQGTKDGEPLNMNCLTD